MDRLTALPVAGDSYLLQRSGKNILVDGGCNSRELVAALSSNTIAVDHLHIVVCTHADYDHAGGLTDFLDNSTIHVDEFWLPGAWADPLPELLRSPQALVNKLIAELDRHDWGLEADLDENPAELKKQFYAQAAERRHPYISKPQDKYDSENQESLQEWLKKKVEDLIERNGEEDARKAFQEGRSIVRCFKRKGYLSAARTKIWIGAINTAERIGKISMQAVRHGATVRWFDYGEFVRTRCVSGGDIGLLEPLNAVELVVPPAPLPQLPYLYKLTPVNEECLVFWSPANHEWPFRWLFGLGVVFTGDSPLGEGPGYRQSMLDHCGEEYYANCVVATAPHHGSESNSMAYEHLEQVFKVVLWLRSGGSRRHPGLTFKSLLAHQRACSYCPQIGYERQAATVELLNHWPIFRVNSRICCCTMSDDEAGC